MPTAGDPHALRLGLAQIGLASIVAALLLFVAMPREWLGLALLGLIPLADLHSLAGGRLERITIRERLGRPQMGAFMRANVPLSATAMRLLQALAANARSMVAKRRPPR